MADDVYCCPLCAHEWRRQQHIKEEREKVDETKRVLHDYICQVFGLELLTPMIKHQIKNYRREYNYTYEGIYATLLYCFNYTDPPVKPQLESGIAFVPFYYEEAKLFYLRRKNVRNQMATLASPNDAKARHVTIQASDRQKERRRFRMIDIESLGVDDDASE